AGGGPRHFTFHPRLPVAYANNEITSSVSAYAFDVDKSSLQELQTLSTLPGPAKGNSTAEIVVHPSGKFLYVSNRGHDSIAMFAIDADKGTLTALGHESTRGKTPRNFAIDPSGRYLLAANEDSNNIAVFRIDAASGLLQYTDQLISVPTPVCI